MPHILKIDTKIKVEHRIIMPGVRAHPKEARIVCPGNLCGKFLSASLRASCWSTGRYPLSSKHEEPAFQNWELLITST